MKQKDIALIAIIAIVSGVLAMVASHFFFSSKGSKQQTAEVVDVINSAFTQPPAKYFNGSAIDPTQLIQIGGTSNPNPFH